MTSFFQSSKESATRRFLSIVILAAFILSSILQNNVFASPAMMADLPTAGTMIGLTKAYMPVSVKGLMVHPENPFRFDFLVDSGDTGLKTDALKAESLKLVKYFLAALTTPEKDMWVNLSPYEKNRVIPKTFGDTELGRDVLAQDYILKQLTSSLTYPETAMGKKFWDSIYEEAQRKFGSNNVPVNTFNKVWIVPSKARVYEHGNGAFVVESKLKVMLEEDYVALNKSKENPMLSQGASTYHTHTIGAQIVREIIIPALEKEVNEGAHFANLRQIYQAMILATWYKIRLKDSIIAKQYVDQAKTKGIETKDKKVNEKIYQQYLTAFKKGAYNYIKESGTSEGKSQPRKYVSGGVPLFETRRVLGISQAMTAGDIGTIAARGAEAVIQFQVNNSGSSSQAMISVSNLLDMSPQEQAAALDKLTVADVAEIQRQMDDTSFPRGTSDQILAPRRALADRVSAVLRNKGVPRTALEKAHVSQAMIAMSTFIQQSPVSKLSADAIAVLGAVGERSREAANFIRQQAIYMGAENIVIVGGLEGKTEKEGQASLIASEQALIKQGLVEGRLRKTIDGNYWVKPNEADTARVINRTIVATRNAKDKGTNNNWRDTEYVLNNVMPKFRNAFAARKDKTLYVIPFLMEPEGANFGLPSFELTDSLIVALQSISMARVGQPAWKALETTGRFHKGIHFSGDLDNLRRGGTDDTDDRWFVSMPDEEDGWTVSYGSEYGGNVLFGKKFEGLRLAQWVAAKDLFGKMAEHMALIEVTHNATGKKKYIAYVGASNQGKTNFATMKAEAAKQYGDQYTVKLVSDDLLKFRVTEDGKLTAFNPENGIFAVVSDTGEESNPNLWKMIGPNTGTIFSLMAYKEVTEGEHAGELELWWKGKTKQPPQDITGWRDWTGKLIADRIPTQEDVDKVLNKDPNQPKKMLEGLTEQEIINVKRLMASWEHPNGRATTKMSNAPNVSSEINNPKGVEIDAIIFGGRAPMPGFIPAIRQLNSFEQGLYSMMTMFTLTTAAEAGAIGVRMRDPGAMRPFFSLHEIDYFLNWIKVRRIVEEKGGKMPLLFQGNWFQQEGGKGRFLWPGFSENIRLVDWVFRMTDGEAKYIDSPIGRLPQIDDINVKGLDVTRDDLKTIFGFNTDIWKDEAVDSFKFLLSLADQQHPLPEEFIKAFDLNRKALDVVLPDREEKFTEGAQKINSILSSINGVDLEGVDRVLRAFVLGHEYNDTIAQLNSNGLTDMYQIMQVLTVYLKVVVSDEAQIAQTLKLPKFQTLEDGRRVLILAQGTEEIPSDLINEARGLLMDSGFNQEGKYTVTLGFYNDRGYANRKTYVVGVAMSTGTGIDDQQRKNEVPLALAHKLYELANVDKATISNPARNGGIDLQAKNINLKIDADKAMSTKTPWNLNNIHIEGGLIPTIIGIETKVNLPLLLGLRQETATEIVKI